MPFGLNETCNMMTGRGFDMSFGGSFSMAWLAMVILFFLVVFSRKWIGEMFDLPFNSIGAFVGAYLPFLIVVSLFCAVKWALLAGIIGFIIGAFVIGQFIGDGGGGGYGDG